LLQKRHKNKIPEEERRKIVFDFKVVNKVFEMENKT
jgi:hypothetical protein